MGDQIKVLAFAGSARQGSFNRQLVNIAGRGAEQAGASVTRLDLADLNMPLFDQDDLKRNGFPEPAMHLKEIMNAHDAFLFASPEYNASVSAPFKNAIDWASRPLPGESWKQCFVGKTAAIMCASTGGMGGLAGLSHLRQILSAMHVIVIPRQLAVGKAGDAFNKDGDLVDSDQQERAQGLGIEVVGIAKKLST